MNKNGGAALEGQEEAKTVVPTTSGALSSRRSATEGPRRPQRARRADGRRRHAHATENVRYFVGRPGDGDSKPTLEQEVASEPEALVIAFKNDSRVYLINEYRVTQRIESGQVRLEKEPASAVQRVSSLNAS